MQELLYDKEKLLENGDRWEPEIAENLRQVRGDVRCPAHLLELRSGKVTCLPIHTTACPPPHTVQESLYR